MRLLCTVLLCLELFGLGCFCFAQIEEVDVSSQHASICLGRDPVSGEWGVKVPDSTDGGYCPDGQALVGALVNYGSSPQEVEKAPLFGFCCPIPKDILTDQHQFVTTVCPNEYLSTGAKILNGDTLMRCTQIDTTLYKLSSVTAGQTFSYGLSFLDRVNSVIFNRSKTNPQVINWSTIPAGLRYGVGRISQFTWSHTGCIGYPFGAILTGRFGRSCSDMRFQQLLKKNPPADEPDSILQVFRDCRAITNQFSIDATCID